MNKLRNDRYLRALLNQPVDMTPVWMMRQAGRYLPEYRQIRAGMSGFMQLCQTPELACEVTLQPLKRYALDAAIIFSDILTIPDAMGLGLHFIENEGPCFEHPIINEAQIKQLPLIDPNQDLRYVMEAIRLTRHELDNSVPLIGFSGSPWTLATYMVEGKSSKSFTKIKKMLYTRPDLLNQLLSKLANNVIAYLNAQIEAGAQALMIFDTWGGVLTHEAYLQFSLSYMQKIIQGLNLEQHGMTIPVTIFTKGGGAWLSDMAQTGCHCVGLDWTSDISAARGKIGGQVALQGNLDPSILYADPVVIEMEVAKILAKFGAGSGHVFNLGHGIHPDVPPEHVQVFVESVHQRSKQYHMATV